jgi:hypothetical protein
MIVKDVNTPRLNVTIMMHVQLTDVILLLDASTLLNVAMITTLVLMMIVIRTKDAQTPKLFAMMKMNVQLTLANHPVGAYLKLM